MILVLLLICLLIFAVGAFMLDRADDSFFALGAVSTTIGVIGTVVSIIALVVLAIDVSSLSVVDERIAMYQEENTRIETQIAEVVTQYQKYETDIFESVSKENAITYVTLYPELKSDSLVQAQIETYVANNEKIKALKDNAIHGSVYRWWLYFGK